MVRKHPHLIEQVLTAGTNGDDLPIFTSTALNLMMEVEDEDDWG
jgi:hypothetical protein